MANLLTDLTLTSAHTFTGSFADITGMSDSVTIAGPSSVVILMTSNIPAKVDGGDACIEYRFTVDGSPVGPELSALHDTNSEFSGREVMFAVDGLSAGSHTFAVQGRIRSPEGDGEADTARERTFQVLELLTDASILVDLSSVAANTAPASFANIVGLSASATPQAGSVLLMIAGVTHLATSSDESAEYRFAIDGAQDGPYSMSQNDNVDEMDSMSMAWAETGVSAASHTFSVQWQELNGTVDMDTGRARTLQVLEFTANADLLVDNISVAADTAPGTFADMVAMSGSPDIDGLDSVALVLADYIQESISGTDMRADSRLTVGGLFEGAIQTHFKDFTGRTASTMMARAFTGESGVTAFAMQWEDGKDGPVAEEVRERTFQVIDLVAPSANMAGTIPLTLTPAATIRADGELAGSSNLVITPAGTLTALGELIGSTALVLTPAGTIRGIGELAGGINLVISPTGTIQATGALAGSADLVLTPAATIQALGALLGSAALVLTPAGTIQATGALSGAVALLLTPAGALQAQGELIGTAALVFTVDGDLQAVGANLAGVIPLVLTATGTLQGLGALAGATTITITPSGTLQATGGLLGTASLSLTLAGNLAALGELLGSSDLILTPSGNLAGKAELAGSADLVLDAAGALGGIGGLAGTVPLTLDAVGALLARGALSGGLTMILTPSGTIRADAAIDGGVSLVFTLAGALQTFGALAGSVDMVITPAGNIIGVGELAGSADLAISADGVLGAKAGITGSAQLTLDADGTLRAVGELQGLAELAFTLAGSMFDQSARRIPNSIQTFLAFLQNTRQDLSAGELNSDQSLTAGRINSEQ